MAKLFLAIVLTVCLAYVVQCQEGVARGAHWSNDEADDGAQNNGNDEQDLWAHVKQFKKLLLQKKLQNQNNHQQPPQQHVSVNKSFKALFVQVQCETNTCPRDCPGTCGSYEGSLVCVCRQLNFVNPCTQENLSQGFYLHPYRPDSSKFLACGPVPGPVYIKTCPHGLVYDERFCVCNYPWALSNGHH